MLWMGEEFGEYTRQTPNQPNKLQWELLKYDRNRELLDYYKKLIALRKSNPALYTENIEFFHENPEERVLAYVRWNNEGDRVVVVANFSGNDLAGYRVLDFPAVGTWHEWTENETVEAGEDGLTIDLSAYQAKVLVWQ